MVATNKVIPHFGGESPVQFTVQICSKEGRLLSEYLLTGKKDNIKTLAGAEQKALNNLSDSYDEQLVIVVSEEAVDNIKQVQLRVVPPPVEED